MSATDAEVIEYLLGRWREGDGRVGTFDGRPEGGYRLGLYLFDGEYSYGPIPTEVELRLRELGHL